MNLSTNGQGQAPVVRTCQEALLLGFRSLDASSGELGQNAPVKVPVEISTEGLKLAKSKTPDECSACIGATACGLKSLGGRIPDPILRTRSHALTHGGPQNYANVKHALANNLPVSLQAVPGLEEVLDPHQ